MSSLHAINRGTKSNPGGGIPFYDKLGYIFSARNNEFNSIDGVWRVPKDKVPTFQLWLPENTLVSFLYRETDGGNNFTGTTFNPIASGAALKTRNVTKDGSPFTVWSSDYSDILLPVAPEGRWILELAVSDGINPGVFYYSEEFVTSDCCGY